MMGQHNMGGDLLSKPEKLSIKELLIGKPDSKSLSEDGDLKDKTRAPGDKEEKKRRFPPAKELFLQLFPGIDVQRPLGANNPKPKMVDSSSLDYLNQS